MSPTPTNEDAEVPKPLPVAQRQDQFTEDYFRDDMAVFEVSHLFRARILSSIELAFRLRALFFVFPNVSLSPVLESSNPCFLIRRKGTEIQTRVLSPCPT